MFGVAGLVLSALLISVHCDDVIVLEESNFDDIVLKEDLMLVEFYAPWCGHCKHLEPEFKKAAAKLLANDPPIKLGKVDATAERELGEKYKIQGYPTLFVFRKGETSEYNGPRDADGIVAHMKKQAAPAFHLVNTVDDANKFLGDEVSAHIVAFLSNLEGPEHDAVIGLANRLRESDKTSLAITSSVEVADHLGATIPSITLFKADEDEKKVVYSGAWEVDSILKYLSARLGSLAVAFTQENIQEFFASGVPVSIAFLESDTSDADQKKVLAALKDLGRRHRGQLNFGYGLKSDEMMGQILEFLGIDAEGPQFSILKFGAGGAPTKYILSSPSSNLDTFVQQFGTFSDDFAAGKVKPSRKSQAVPDTQDSAVYTVVGDSF
jgi:protein disulfide-isomerase A1